MPRFVPAMEELVGALPRPASAAGARLEDRDRERRSGATRGRARSARETPPRRPAAEAARSGRETGAYSPASSSKSHAPTTSSGRPSDPMSARKEIASSVAPAASRAAATRGSRSACGAIQMPPPSEPIPARARRVRTWWRTRRRSSGIRRTTTSHRRSHSSSSPNPKIRSRPALNSCAVSGVTDMRVRLPRRSPVSHPSRVLRATACRAVCSVWSRVTSAETSDSCQTAPCRGIAYSPSTVSSTERAAGGPTLRRRSAPLSAPPVGNATSVMQPRARAPLRCPRRRSP